MADEKNANCGVGFLALMFLIFMTLKLCGIINWSWWWVTAPLWLPVVIMLSFLLILLLIAVIYEFFRKR